MNKRKKTTRKKANDEQDLTIKEKEIEVAKVSLAFPITRDEAEAVINDPEGVIAKKLKSYMELVLNTACQKFVDTPKKENVNNCKLNLE